MILVQEITQVWDVNESKQMKSEKVIQIHF